MSKIDLETLKRNVERLAQIMYARGENPTSWRIAEVLGGKDLTWKYVNPMLKLWRSPTSILPTAGLLGRVRSRKRPIARRHQPKDQR